MSKLLSTVAVCAGLMFTAAAHAAPVVWTLDSVSFTDGRTATGSFTFDAATTTYLALSITTSSGASYDLADIATLFGSDASGINVIDGFVSGGDNTGRSILNLDFVSALTDAGGTVSIVTGFPSFEGACGVASCGSGSVLRQTVAGGSVIGTRLAVPSPSALSLLGLGLVALAWSRRVAR